MPNELLNVLLDMIEADVKIIEADRWLKAQVGLGADYILDGSRQIDIERRAYLDAYPDSTVTGVLECPAGRHWVTVWHAHGLSARMCAVIAVREVPMHDQATAEIDAYITGRPNVVEEREVMALHRAGVPLIDISRRLGLNRTNLYKIYERLGVTPISKQPRIQDGIRNKVIRDRNKGDSQPQICARYGLTTSQYKSILRYAARAGLVPDYGTRAAGSAS